MGSVKKAMPGMEWKIRMCAVIGNFRDIESQGVGQIRGHARSRGKNNFIVQMK
jgi:hypothetical protein